MMSSLVSLSPREVADFFIDKARSAEAKGEVVTNLALQKLVYYSYVWYLIAYGEKLFEEEIVAWKHGPVVRSLYSELSKYGRESIRDLASVPGDLEERIRLHLKAIWDSYGRMSAGKLVDRTHEEKPWVDAHSQAEGSVITREAIESFYGSDEGADFLPSGCYVDDEDGFVYDKCLEDSHNDLIRGKVMTLGNANE